VSYRRAAIEEVSFPPGSFDLVVSSLALHYVADFGAVVERVASWLRPNGRFVFSVEHPITTAHMDMPDWVGDEEGTRLNCPVDDYGDEGPRTQEWFVPGVRKYLRRLSTYVNTLIDAGLIIDGVDEPVPTPETIADHPVLADELRQPAFLVVACRKPEKGG
jgi:SAM-dependent methyltransferase